MGGLNRLVLQWKEERERRVRLWRENGSEERCGGGCVGVAMGVGLWFGWCECWPWLWLPLLLSWGRELAKLIGLMI